MPSSRLKIVVEGIAGVALIGVHVIFAPLLRPWYRRWGASEAEVKDVFPGDEFVPRPQSELTCGITVDAPAEQIWPWLVQLGCQRGGWYSYDLLDNGGLPSAERIFPEYQHLEVGDVVKAVPDGAFGFPVARIEAGRALVLAGTLNTKTGQPADPHGPIPEAYFSGDQTFVIRDAGVGKSRLLFRMRMDWDAGFMNNLIYAGLMEPVSAVMGRKMLRTLKKRAEGR